MQNLQNAGGTIASVNGRENHKWHAGSNPVLATKNLNTFYFLLWEKGLILYYQLIKHLNIMKLIKLPQDHYIIVDDSSLKEGDYVLSKLNEVEVFGRRYTPSLYRKITHSTQPIEQYYGATDGTIPFVYHKIIELPLSEVKELIGEKSWKGYIDGTEWEVEIVDGKLKLV